MIHQSASVAVTSDMLWFFMVSDEGPYTKHSSGSRPSDGALAIRRQSIPGSTQTNTFK